MGKNLLLQNIPIPTINKKSDLIETTRQAILDINDDIEKSKSIKTDHSYILNDIQKSLFDHETILQKLQIETQQIEDTIKEILLSKDINLKNIISTQVENLNKNKSEIKKINQIIQSLQKNNAILIQNIQMIENDIKVYKEEKDILLHAEYLNYLKENSSHLTLNDLLIKPDGIEQLIQSYNNPKIPSAFLDKVIFLKGDPNSGKHSAIKALGNELNRPVFRIKYDDYINELGLNNIFIILIDYLRKQRTFKNEQINYHNGISNLLKTIKNTIYNPKHLINIIDELDISHECDLGSQSGKKNAIKMLTHALRQTKENIKNIEDSCILYIDDLDQIIDSTKYDKGELLGPIKSIIEDIKNEDHNVLLILVGNNLGPNHNAFKHKIDGVFDFNNIEYKYQDLFNKIISKYYTKINTVNNPPKLILNNLPREYQDIKTIDKIAKAIIRETIMNDTPITQGILDKELNNFIKGRKSLFSGIGLK